MAELVVSVLSLEKKADDLVTQAHQKAKEIDQKAQTRVASSGQEIETRLKEQIDAFRQEAEKKHQEELQRADIEFESAMTSLDRIPSALVSKQIDLIVSRFREL